jgi:hypothetical protein
MRGSYCTLSRYVTQTDRQTDRQTKAYKSKREILTLDIILECVQATWKIIQFVIPRE